MPLQDRVRLDWVQGSRDVIAAHLAACKPDRRCNFVEETSRISTKIGDVDGILEVYHQANLLAISVFAERIMPALRLFGLLDFDYAKKRKEYAVKRGWGIEWFSMTTLGVKILGGVHADAHTLA